MDQQTFSLRILFPTAESCGECFPGVDVSTDFAVQLTDGISVQGKPAIQAAGLSMTEILIQAMVTVPTGVTVKVIGEVVWGWIGDRIGKSKQAPKISIGN